MIFTTSFVGFIPPATATFSQVSSISSPSKVPKNTSRKAGSFFILPISETSFVSAIKWTVSMARFKSELYILSKWTWDKLDPVTFRSLIPFTVSGESAHPWTLFNWLNIVSPCLTK